MEIVEKKGTSCQRLQQSDDLGGSFMLPKRRFGYFRRSYLRVQAKNTTFARHSANMPAYREWHALSLTRHPTGQSSHHRVSWTDTSSNYHHDMSNKTPASAGTHALSHGWSSSHAIIHHLGSIKLSWTDTSSCYYYLLVTKFTLPNEDFGRMNKR